jgi:hypothetical protein
MRMLVGLLTLQVVFGQAASVVSLSNGVQLRIGIRGTGSSLKTDMEPASGNSFYRIFRDENNLDVFAYEILVDRSADGERFHIIAKPAGSEYAAKFPNSDGGKPVPTLSETHDSEFLTSGQRFEVEIPTNPGTREILTDSMQVTINRRGAPAPDSGAAATTTGRLRFVNLKVAINGRDVTTPGAGAVVSGIYAMFYLPGHGGYFFSTQQVDKLPFTHVGSVDRRVLRFTVDNENIECTSESGILTQSERGEVWVYHDPNYKPEGNWTKTNPADGSSDEFFTAASDSLKWWLP